MSDSNTEYIVGLESTVFVNADEDAPEEVVLERAAEIFNNETWRRDQCKIVDVVEG